MNRLALLGISCLVSLSIYAQGDPEPQPNQEVIIQNSANSRLYGKLVDQASNKGIEAASVQLFSKNAAGQDSLIRGMLTRPNGDFSFDNLPSDSSFILQISAIGYEPVQQVIIAQLNPAGAGIMNKDLGNIGVAADVQQLGGVVVTANRPALEMGIDRKVFNASKSLIATGGTAIDLMRNIPSVSVDIEGNVTLRNSTPQIFVDGRPTILTLDQIPADNIEKVELITNPSAKFDAASSGGIINIVLKKNKRVGLNGVASAGIGYPGILNGNLNLNLRQGKFNIFASGGYNGFGGRARAETYRENKDNGIITDYFNQESWNERKRKFYSVRFGTDFFIDNRNTITFTQQIGRGRFSWDEDQDQEYLDSGKQPIYFGQRLTEGSSRFRRNSSALNYKHNFPKSGKELTADVTFNYGGRNENSYITNDYFLPGGGTYQPSSIVNNFGDNSNKQVIAQIDFVNPLGENGKLELGARTYYNDFRSTYNAFNVAGGASVKLPLSNNYEYTEMVNAIYGTWSGKIKTWQYQLGLRAEQSQFNGELIDSAFKFGYDYPSSASNIWNALFPSIFITKELDETQQLQVNFSRRIRRPDFWRLNPFIDINDPNNLRQGNPQLRPEFVNSFELNYSKNYKQGNFLGVLYFRNNPDDIMEYSDTISAALYEQLADAGVAADAILNTFINASTTNRYGAEFTLQHKVGNNFDITPTINLQYRTVKAMVEGQDLSNEGFNWEAKLITNYKFPSKRGLFKEFSLQLLGEYESPEVIAQGRRKSQYSMDLALRKDFLKGNKGTLTFGINDVFNSDRWGTIFDTERFYQDSYRRWNVRSFRLTFSYRFGDADFSLTRSRGDRGGGGGDD